MGRLWRVGKTENRSLDHKTLEHIRLLAVERGGQVVWDLSDLHLQVVAGGKP
jgi:hypothetical protein